VRSITLRASLRPGTLSTKIPQTVLKRVKALIVEKTKITIVRLGYVGMSLSVLLGRRQDVVALGIDQARVATVNAGRPTEVDPDMEEVMAGDTLSLVATTDPAEAYQGAAFIVVATPTDYDPDRNYFNTKSVEQVID
jgi:UDPglucose 6-dehydrogenase